MAYAAYTLLKVAIEQRELLNFGPATLIYHAARLCAESSSEKVGDTAELERDIVEKIDSIENEIGQKLGFTVKSQKLQLSATCDKLKKSGVCDNKTCD